MEEWPVRNHRHRGTGLAPVGSLAVPSGDCRPFAPSRGNCRGRQRRPRHRRRGRRARKRGGHPGHDQGRRLSIPQVVAPQFFEQNSDSIFCLQPGASQDSSRHGQINQTTESSTCCRIKRLCRRRWRTPTHIDCATFCGGGRRCQAPPLVARSNDGIRGVNQRSNSELRRQKFFLFGGAADENLPSRRERRGAACQPTGELAKIIGKFPIRAACAPPARAAAESFRTDAHDAAAAARTRSRCF